VSQPSEQWVTAVDDCGCKLPGACSALERFLARRMSSFACRRVERLFRGWHSVNRDAVQTMLNDSELSRPDHRPRQCR